MPAELPRFSDRLARLMCQPAVRFQFVFEEECQSVPIRYPLPFFHPFAARRSNLCSAICRVLASHPARTLSIGLVEVCRQVRLMPTDNAPMGLYNFIFS